MQNTSRTAALACALAFSLPAAAAVDPDAFVQRDQLTYMTISPNGDYLAMTVPEEDQTGLVVIRRKDMSVSAAVKVGKNVHILEDFRWVNPGKIVFHVAERFGALEQPQATGELASVEAEGGAVEILVGFRAGETQIGTRLATRKQEAVYAQLVDDLRDDDRHVIVSISPFSMAPQTQAEEMDVESGRRTVVARVPVRRAVFTTDHAGVVRFARGSGADNLSKLYYRDGRESEWRLVNDEGASRHVEVPLGFSRDGKLAYLMAENAQGTNAIVSFDPATGQRQELLRDPDVDPWQVLYALEDSSTPVGVTFMNGQPRAAFLDAKSLDAKIYAGLAQAFPGQAAVITSTSKDGSQALVSVYSASKPGDYYVLDTKKFTAEHVFSRREVLNKVALGEVRPVTLKARDGTVLHGYLTLPPGSDGKKLPMVVMPHGGPIGIFDEWTFDDDAQLLASAGYAVLKVNFRGSGNYGRAFMRAGQHEWGGRMQQDVTDATHWAIEQGIADAGRICIYGASYGGYAALMGVASEPGLYRCAVGYVGVYDLPQLVDELEGATSQETFGREWIGDDRTALAAKSPNRLAAQIKVPVLLAAGGEDRTAPISHSRKMEKALRDAGVPVETLYFDTEGHGFHLPAHRRAFYDKLLAFLAKNNAANAQ